MNAPRRPRIGLVLGSGSARGWAHIGVIRSLERAGFRPDVVCGTSIGALVGAIYAAGELQRFEEWVLGMKLRDVISFMDVRLSGGLLKGARLMGFIRRTFADQPIEDLPIPFGAVATSLYTGTEVWLRTGSMFDAIRASLAMPGLFTPVLHDDVMLVDGGLVNPVPVSLGRAMGAEILIAVDLSSDLLGRNLQVAVSSPAPQSEQHPGQMTEWMRRLHSTLVHPSDAPKAPSMMNVVATSLNIMQVRITRSRMAGEPPDVLVAPRLARLGLLDFHRAKEAIEEGERAMDAALPSLALLGLNGTSSAAAPAPTPPPE